MKKGKKIKIKKKYFHPITSYLLMSLLVIVVSFLLGLFDFKSTYSVINTSTIKLEHVTSEVVNLLNLSELKDLISNVVKNFASFAPLSMYLVSAIGLAVCEASGFIDVLFKRIFNKLDNKFLTFLIIFVATLSSLINEIGYVILIPLSAMIFKAKNRNPLAGICAAFAGVAFGYGTSFFVGSAEVSLIPYTTMASHLLDSTFHISLTANLYIMIFSSFVLSIVGTYIIEKIIVKRVGKYDVNKNANDIEIIEEFSTVEQNNLNKELLERRGLKFAGIFSIIFILLFIYSLIPSLPGSGLLLKMDEETYLKQLFGENAYFQDAFTFLISLYFMLSGLIYGIGSKVFKNDSDVINATNNSTKKVGNMLLLFFVASQFLAIFRRSNIGMALSGVLSNMLSSSTFGGIPYLLICFFVIILSDFINTSTHSKWMILSPIIIPIFMKTNIAPQFIQFVFRGADSIANGLNPLYAYFVMYVGYMNIYNNADKPITIKECIRVIFPYFIIIAFAWLLILIGWYIIGLPIGPGVYPTL